MSDPTKDPHYGYWKGSATEASIVRKRAETAEAKLAMALVTLSKIEKACLRMKEVAFYGESAWDTVLGMVRDVTTIISKVDEVPR